MQSAVLAALVGFAAAQVAIPAGIQVPSTAGFNQSYVLPSRGGKAICVGGMVPVNASTPMNLKLNYQLPANQSQLTQSFISMITPGSPFMEQIMGGMTTVSGSWNISSHLCMPANSKPKAVQFLTHGVGFDGYYWDFAPGYSYVDAAADAGYATFYYDRLGTGASSKPDAISVVQAPLEVAIAEQLIKKLSAGTFSGMAFQKVVGVGHSFGSIITEAIAANYPSSLAAAIHTGFSMNMTGLAAFTVGNNFGIASQVNPIKYASLSNGYAYPQDATGVQVAFFHEPGFDPNILSAAYAQGSTVTVGELFTQSAVTKPAMNFTGPVAIVNGEEDLPFCFGNCTYPVNKAQAPLKMLFPMSKNATSYIAPMAGHGLNLHYSALNAYHWINSFLADNGITA